MAPFEYLAEDDEKHQSGEEGDRDDQCEREQEVRLCRGHERSSHGSTDPTKNHGRPRPSRSK